MHTAKIAISLDETVLKKLDFYVKKHVFKNRSQAIQLSINQTLEHLEHKRLAEECMKLDPQYEQQLADEGLTQDVEWSEY
ncbi:MAG TPA: ribbon-helix-helix domain-containing protein [Gammaproteobacteria bacterium]|jgi:metal-responsive CopG/Arc/MetJ family transcriptional regulator|nr:ribbon-helix-helix domain-containing protein [Gammaproteobacteria bacterium]